MRPVYAVLFDMDGLLVSTEETWFAVETEAMAWLGGPWGPEHQAALVGGPMHRTLRYMLDLADRPDVAPHTLEQRLLSGMVGRLRDGAVRWMPGARRLLSEVGEAGLSTALVSSSSRLIMDAVLDAVGREHFAVTVSADDVPRTKPHPDPYLAAASALDVAAVHCVALEDSATGAASARAAGCLTVVVPSVAPVADDAADAVAGSLADIDIAWLRRLAAAQPAASEPTTPS